MPAHVRLYVCGPTVYDYVHIGNARPVVAFDVLYRLLKRRYPRVTYVRNITDIDDRIIVRAADNRRDHRGADRAHRPAPTRATCGGWARSARCRAARHAVRRRRWSRMIERLVDNGHAYAAEGHVLFSVPSMSRLRPPVAPHARRAGRRRPGRGGAVQEGPGRLRAVEALDRQRSRAGRARGAAAGRAGTSSARR